MGHALCRSWHGRVRYAGRENASAVPDEDSPADIPLHAGRGHGHWLGRWPSATDVRQGMGSARRMRVGSADYPPTDPSWSLVRRTPDGDVADVQDTWPDDPTVQGQLAIELGPDPAECVELLVTGVGVDRGDDASLANRMNADQGITDGERLTGKLGLDVRRHSGENDVGSQPADAVAKALHCAVCGYEEVQNIESLRRGIGYESSIGATMCADDLRGLRRVPSVTVHHRSAIRSGGDRNGEQAMSGAAGEGPSSTGNVDDAITLDAVWSQEDRLHRLAPERLDRVTPEFRDPGVSHDFLPHGRDRQQSSDAMLRYPASDGGQALLRSG